MNKLTVNSIDYTTCISGLQDLKLNVTKSRDNAFDVAISSQVKCTGQLFDYLEQQFILDADGRDAEVLGSIYISCCATSYNFRITADLLEYCPLESEMGFPLQLDSSDFERYDRFRQRILWYDANDTNDVTDFFASVPPIMLEVENLGFLGGNRWNASFLIREALAYNCNLCGLNFVSSILTSTPYRDLLYLPPINTKGSNGVSYSYIEENLPNLTSSQLLELLAPLFNAEFKFINNDVIFERHDFFNATTYTAFDAEAEYPNGNIDELCYKYEVEKASANLIMEYATDPLERDGNERFFVFNGSVTFDNTSRFLKGDRRVNVRFGAVNWESGAARVAIRNHSSANPKVLLWDNEPNRATGLTNESDGDKWLSFSPDRPLSLYHRFYSIDDPTSSTFQKYAVGDFKYTPTEQNFCELVGNILDQSETVGFSTRFGTAIPEAFEIDFAKVTVKFKDIKII